MARDDDAEFGLVMSFWIDTPGYLPRDREMFVCGAEFQQVYAMVKDGWCGERTVHTENASRFRMMASKLGVPCEIVPCEFEGKRLEEWVYARFGEPCNAR